MTDHRTHWPGVVLDVAILATVAVLGALHVLPKEIVIGLLGSLIGARVAMLRSATPPTQSPPPSGRGGPPRIDRLSRVFVGSAFAALVIGLVLLFWHRHTQ